MKIIAYKDAIQYTGDNSSEILTLVGGDVSLISEAGGTPTLSSCGNTHAIDEDEWIRYGNGCVHQVYTPAEFAAEWLLQHEVLGTPIVTGVGVATVPAILGERLPGGGPAGFSRLAR